MEQAALFKRLGYPKHAEKVYEAVLTSEVALAVSTIATHTKLPRMTVYRCLESLVTDALIEPVTVGKRTFYGPGTPGRLAEVTRLADAESGQIAAAYTQKYSADAPRSVRFLHGAAGIRAAFDDVIEHTPKSETFFRYTSEKDLAKVNAYLARDYRERRDKKKLERKVISNAISGMQKKSRLERFIRFIPEEAAQFQQNIIQLVYGKRVSIIDLNKEEVMIVENEHLAEFQKTIFRLLYERLERR